MPLDTAVASGLSPNAEIPVTTAVKASSPPDRARSLPRDPRAVSFERDGFLGPIRLFSAVQCRTIAAYLHRSDHPAPSDWEKGRAARERFLFDLATEPALLTAVAAILGENVVLWGLTALVRSPGVSHPWHSDIESCTPEGGFVTAWIGIEHTTRESALQLITRSHRFGLTVQEARLERGLRRDLATPEMMLEAAREHDPAASLVQPDMTNGDAILFDGRLWHGSFNSRKRGKRLALLVQYATASSRVRIPDLNHLDWPFRLRTAPRPPVIVVSGKALREPNRVVPPPSSSTNPSPGSQMVTTAIHPVVVPVDSPTEQWQTFPAFRGPTATLTDMSCHASVLMAGHAPHALHAHREEELLIPLRGAVELVIGSHGGDANPRIERIDPGTVVYYPAGQFHTIRNPGSSAVAYLMFKWRADSTRRTMNEPVLQTTIWRDLEAANSASGPVHMRRIFEEPTSYLGKLHAHVTTMRPGAGYEPHVDAYDVAILTLSGTVETLGERVGPQSVIYYAAGEEHGMRNVGAGMAQYVVFEFHARGAAALVRGPFHRRQAARAIRVSKRLARAVWRRVRGDWPNS